MNECNSHIQIHTNWIHVQKKSSNWTILHLYVYSLVHMSRYKMSYSHVKKRLHGISHRYLIFSTYSYIKQKVCVCVCKRETSRFTCDISSFLQVSVHMTILHITFHESVIFTCDILQSGSKRYHTQQLKFSFATRGDTKWLNTNLIYWWHLVGTRQLDGDETESDKGAVLPQRRLSTTGGAKGGTKVKSLAVNSGRRAFFSLWTN